MELRHIVGATDDSEVGRHAVSVAARLAGLSGSQLSIVTARPAAALLGGGGHSAFTPVRADPETASAVVEFESWLGPDLLAQAGDKPVELAVTYGLPGIEITRYGETRQTDLLVLGRTRRSRAERLIVGDTADAVARRSRIPCLFVPVTQERFSRVLVALDGSERGFRIYHAACDFARVLPGGTLRAVTVEPVEEDSGTPRLPLARTDKLRQALNRLILAEERQCECCNNSELVVRHGDPVEQVKQEVLAHQADVLVLGYHPGGPPGIIEAGSIARHLVHDVRCAVLTVPL